MKHDVRGLQRFHALCKSKEFLADIEKARQMNEFTRIGHVPWLLQKYNLVSGLGPVLDKYIEQGVVDEGVVSDPVRIMKHEGGAVSLTISHDITAAEFKKFIDRRWKSDIAPKLPGYTGRLVRQETPSPLRDEAIIESWLDKKKTGKTNIGIALEHNVSVAHVNRVIAQYKQSH